MAVETRKLCARFKDLRKSAPYGQRIAQAVQTMIEMAQVARFVLSHVATLVTSYDHRYLRTHKFGALAQTRD